MFERLKLGDRGTEFPVMNSIKNTAPLKDAHQANGMMASNTVNKVSCKSLQGPAESKHEPSSGEESDGYKDERSIEEKFEERAALLKEISKVLGITKLILYQHKLQEERNKNCTNQEAPITHEDESTTEEETSASEQEISDSEPEVPSEHEDSDSEASSSEDVLKN